MSARVDTGRGAALDDVQQGLRQLLGAERRLRGRDQHRTGAGLPHAQIRALFAIGHQDTTAGEIAKAADLSPGAVTAMLDDLEAAGIVARRRSETDRRCVLVSLTEDGRAVLDAARARWRTKWERALEDMPEADLEAATRVLRALAHLFDEL